MVYVYLVKTETDFYKVGIALDVQKRLKALQTSNPQKLSLVTTKPSDEARKLERYIHQKLVKFATKGGSEWFKLSDAKAIEVCVMMQEPIPEAKIKPTTDVPLESQALAVFRKHGYASTSLLQRRLGIGYGRAARIMDTLEEDGFISPLNGSKPRLLLQ